ncbi:MAG: response regulator [bacterium]|jgi:DNA-binding NarL/FixJ family response regulator
MNRTRILLVDDHPLLRQGLRMVLELEPDLTVVGEAGDGEEALRLARNLQAQVVLMDINLPGMSGIEATKLIKADLPATKILALTIHDDDEYVLQMVQAGACGYLLKDVDPGGLVKAIRAAIRGESYISPGIAGKVFGVLNRLTQERYLPRDQVLTQREFEVLELIAQGYSNQRIAQDLTISEKTVKNHVTNIFRKLDVEDRTQAAVYALRHKLVHF